MDNQVKSLAVSKEAYIRDFYPHLVGEYPGGLVQYEQDKHINSYDIPSALNKLFEFNTSEYSKTPLIVCSLKTLAWLMNLKNHAPLFSRAFDNDRIVDTSGNYTNNLFTGRFTGRNPSIVVGRENGEMITLSSGSINTAIIKTNKEGEIFDKNNQKVDFSKGPIFINIGDTNMGFSMVVLSCGKGNPEDIKWTGYGEQFKNYFLVEGVNYRMYHTITAHQLQNYEIVANQIPWRE